MSEFNDVTIIKKANILQSLHHIFYVTAGLIVVSFYISLFDFQLGYDQMINRLFHS